MENCSKIHSDSPSLGLNAATYYANIRMFFPFPFTGRCSLVSPRAHCLCLSISSHFITLSLEIAQSGFVWFPLSQSLAGRNLSFKFLRFILLIPYHLCPSFSFKETNGYIILILCNWLSYKLLKQHSCTYLTCYLGKISLLPQYKCF